jgi:phospholipid/cholesterol/gamma-HCH transport system substrate-binding protein
VKFSKELKVGLLVIAAIGLFYYGFNFLKGKNVFGEQTYVYAVYNHVDGLLEANPLLVNGFKVGQVSKISIRPDNKIIVTFMLVEEIKIPKGAVARIFSSDLLGTKAVQVIVPDSMIVSGFIANGDTLRSENELDLKSAVNKEILPLKLKAENLISSIDSVMTVVTQVLNANVRQSLILTFENLKNTIVSLNHTAYNLDTLVGTQKPRIASILDKIHSIAGNLEKNNDRISNILLNFNNISDSLAKANIKQAIENANLALTEANVLLTQINSGQGTLGKLVKSDSLYNQLAHAANDLDKLFKDLRINPERYVHLSIFGRKDRRKPKD